MRICRLIASETMEHTAALHVSVTLSSPSRRADMRSEYKFHSCTRLLHGQTHSGHFRVSKGAARNRLGGELSIRRKVSGIQRPHRTGFLYPHLHLGLPLGQTWQSIRSYKLIRSKEHRNRMVIGICFASPEPQSNMIRYISYTRETVSTCR